MSKAKGAGPGAGWFAAAAITVALLALFYFGWKVIGLPFVPFDVFDWLTRVLPGRVIAFGISTMVSVIRALHLGPTAATAKLAEQAMALLNLFLAAFIAGVLLFILARHRRGRGALALGLAFGLVLGVPAGLISWQASQTATTSPAINLLWTVVLFLAWGAALGRAYQRLIGGAAAAEAAARDGRLGEAAVERLDRRRFLVRLGGSTAAITVAGAVVGELAEVRRQQAIRAAGAAGRWSATHRLPNAGAALQPAPGTRPEFTPLERHYRIDINTTPPRVDEQQWRLNVTGLVEQPLALTLAELRRFEPLDQFITLSCISNPVGGDLIGTTRWTGVSLRRLLPVLRLKPNATHLKIHAADGFFEVVALETIHADERVMLAYAWDGVPLSQEHGFPLRIYIPDVHGMKQPKWITALEATDHWEPGYWVTRGWDKVAQMKATTVIDTVAVDMTIIHADQRKLVPIGGMAHAGARGISKVEVQVDDGPWQPAMLRTPLSPLTWVLWRYDWPFQPGKHTFVVRCVDGQGAPQIEMPAPAEPGGASGLDSKQQMF